MSGVADEEGTEAVATADGADAVEVLHLDDDEAFLDVSQRFLTRRHDLSVETLTDPADALDRLGEVDCVVSDYDMPSMDGIEFLEAVRERHPDLPFILFTGKGSEEVAGDAISAGVTDYLRKGTGAERFQILANRVRNAVERERARDRAAESDRRIRQVYERITDGFVALGEEWRYTYVNRQAAALLESDPDELLGETIWTSFPGTLDTPIETELRRSFDEQVEVAVEEYYDPLDAWFEIRAFPSESGLSVYFRDVTERKERMTELREERAFVESIFAALPDVFYAFDERGQFLRWNDRLTEVTGYTDEEIAEMTPLDFVPDEEVDTIAAAIDDVIVDGRVVTVESAFETRDGEVIPYEFTGARLTDEHDELLGLVGIGRDVSDVDR